MKLWPRSSTSGPLPRNSRHRPSDFPPYFQKRHDVAHYRRISAARGALMKQGCKPGRTVALTAAVCALSANTALAQAESGSFADRLTGDWRWLDEYVIAGN